MPQSSPGHLGLSRTNREGGRLNKITILKASALGAAVYVRLAITTVLDLRIVKWEI